MILAEPVVRGLQIAGPAFFLSFQGSAIRTALQIIQDKSVGPLSAFPFVSLLTNCVIWSYYGMLKSDMTVLVPNAIGVFTGAGCIAGYHRFATIKPVSMYACAAALIAFSTVLAAQGNYKLLGSLGCVVAVILTGSPLATLKTVIKDRSTAALPVATSTAGWLNACSWSLYGILVAHDPMVSTELLFNDDLNISMIHFHRIMESSPAL
jgi:solute carrier family 50 (sugar transporter)